MLLIQITWQQQRDGKGLRSDFNFYPVVTTPTHPGSAGLGFCSPSALWQLVFGSYPHEVTKDTKFAVNLTEAKQTQLQSISQNFKGPE